MLRCHHSVSYAQRFGPFADGAHEQVVGISFGSETETVRGPSLTSTGPVLRCRSMEFDEIDYPCAMYKFAEGCRRRGVTGMVSFNSDSCSEQFQIPTLVERGLKPQKPGKQAIDC